jgi:membrane protease YdiL (CAAX protease family)
MDLPALVAMGLGALLAAFFLYQCAAMIFSPGARSAYREGVLEGGADLAFLPRTASERSAFTFLGLTAGVTEEVIYRGYLIWAFSLIMPQWGAALLALVAFTSMHAYQGPRGILPVAMAGAFLTVLYLLTGSLWPGIALHAWLDIVNGQTAYLALSDRGLARRQAA